MIFSESARVKCVFYLYLYAEIPYRLLHGFLKQLEGTLSTKLVTMEFVIFVVWWWLLMFMFFGRFAREELVAVVMILMYLLFKEEAVVLKAQPCGDKMI